MHVPAIFATTRRAIAADRKRVLRVLRGFVEAIHQFKTQPATVMPLLQSFLGFSDRSAVERLQRYYASVLPVIPRPGLSDGMQELRNLFSERYPAARELHECNIADTGLIDELEQTGFITQLYSSSPPSLTTRLPGVAALSLRH